MSLNVKKKIVLALVILAVIAAILWLIRDQTLMINIYKHEDKELTLVKEMTHEDVVDFVYILEKILGDTGTNDTELILDPYDYLIEFENKGSPNTIVYLWLKNDENKIYLGYNTDRIDTDIDGDMLSYPSQYVLDETPKGFLEFLDR